MLMMYNMMMQTIASGALPKMVNSAATGSKKKTKK
jgi:hypothetical protein